MAIQPARRRVRVVRRGPVRRRSRHVAETRCHWMIAPVRPNVCQRPTIASDGAAVGIANHGADGASAISENGRLRFAVTRVATAGRRRRRPVLLVSHRAPCGIGIEVGAQIGWRRVRGGGRRRSPRSSAKPRSPAFWNCTARASAYRVSRPSIPMSRAPNWLSSKRNIVPSGSKSMSRNGVGWSGSAEAARGRWISLIPST